MFKVWLKDQQGVSLGVFKNFLRYHLETKEVHRQNDRWTVSN
jgi:hypothetical protein